MDLTCYSKYATSRPSTLEVDMEIEQKSSSSAKSDVQTLKKDWASIDPPLLDHIYSFLNRTDQFNMSLVCKSWLEGYESPHIWRHFKFYLPEYVCSCYICPGIKFPRKFGHFFRHVELICKEVQIYFMNEILLQLKMFLDCITYNSQLHSIKFIDLCEFFIQLDEQSYAMLFKSIENFFAKQNNLKVVEFRDSLFLHEDCAKILNAACKNSSHTLETIILKGFVTDFIVTEGQEFEDLEIYSSVKNHIINLTTLRTDYSQLLENVIMSVLIEPRNFDMTGRLSLLEIVCDGYGTLLFQGIDSDAWQGFCRLCPSLKVHMVVSSPRYHSYDYSFYINSHIPIQLLEYRIMAPLESRHVNIGNFFRHITNCGCHNQLENLTLVWMPLVGNLTENLIPFLNYAKKLKKLHIDLRHPVYGIKEFMEWLTEDNACLKSVRMSVGQVRREDIFNNIVDLAEAYSPRFQDSGLDVSLEAYPI